MNYTNALKYTSQSQFFASPPWQTGGREGAEFPRSRWVGGREGPSLRDSLRSRHVMRFVLNSMLLLTGGREEEGALGPPGPVTKTKPPLLGDLAPVHLTCLIAHKLLLAPAIHFRRATNTLIIISSICFDLE